MMRDGHVLGHVWKAALFSGIVFVVPACVPLKPRERARHSERYQLEEHRKNYFALGSYNASVNKKSPKRIEDFEWMFQISVRHNIIDWDDERVSLAYTNKSFWQIGADSAPFRATDHEPEVFYEKELENEGGPARTRLRGGIVHQSNGESGADSRSWNRVYAEYIRHSPGWYAGSAVERAAAQAIDADLPDVSWRWSIKPWYLVSKESNNRRLASYTGYFELSGDVALGSEFRHLVSGSLRNNLRFDGDNRGLLTLTYSVDVYHGLRVFVQHANGYAESLIDFDDSTNRWSIGIELWRHR